MYSFFIGCDVSKAVLDIACFEKNKAVYLGRFSNDIDGFKRLFKKLELMTNDPISSWFFCFENTGIYSKNLLIWLYSQGITCVEECPLKIKKSLGLRRGKEDKADSMAICMYGYEKKEFLKPSVPSKPLITSLKSLVSRRERLIRMRTIAINARKSQDPGLPMHLVKIFNEHDKEHLETLESQISKIEVLMKEVLRQNDEVEKNAQLLQSVIGIGLITAVNFIAITNNFEDFSNARKFACYSGVAPFPNSSGIRRGRTKVSGMANKKIKGLLSNGALSAIVHDPELKLYYRRKIEEGKPSGVVLNAVKNKLIQRAFAVINRQSVYIKSHKYAS